MDIYFAQFIIADFTSLEFPPAMMTNSPGSQSKKVIVIKFQVFRGNGESNGSGFAGFQENFLKTFQLFHRSCNAANQIADIKLNNFGAVEFARIGKAELAVNVWRL